MSFKYKIYQKFQDSKLILRFSTYYLEYFSWAITKIFRKKKEYPKNIKNVLIINHGALGDIFSSLRILYNLKKSYPSINFYFLGYESYYEDVRFLEKLIDFKLVDEKEILRINFDLVKVFSLSRHKKKLVDKIDSYFIGSEYSSISESIYGMFNGLYDLKVFPRPFKRHKIIQELMICKKAGLEIHEVKDMKIKIPSSLIKKYALGKYILIHPCGRNFSDIYSEGKIPNLAWPIKRFSKFSDYIIDKYGYNVLISGSKEEFKLNQQIIEGVKNKNKIKNLSGKLSIEELFFICAEAKLVLSIDTSAVHISELVGVPIVALFGPTFPEEVGAFGKKKINLHNRRECIMSRNKGPCYGKNNKCMESISLDQVIMASETLLGS